MWWVHQHPRSVLVSVAEQCLTTGWTTSTAVDVNGRGVLEPITHAVKASRTSLAFVDQASAHKTSSAATKNGDGAIPASNSNTPHSHTYVTKQLDGSAPST